ncbi:MAG: Dam family site-specific DNA-(adenine-N6)-methyltransferase [Gammaproteobacteria bacterium]
MQHNNVIDTRQDNEAESVFKLTRPFLKWAGNKFRLLPFIKPLLPKGKRLIEPFAGSAAVFLNTEFKSYVLGDCNPDLINLYIQLQKHGDNFIDQAVRYFKPMYNKAGKYYELRERFNSSKKANEKAALFLYLNRHGYNGLCRYNSKHIYNVPFGRYEKPYFPLHEMQIFHQKAQHAEFICSDFEAIMKSARKGDHVYCDPPYVPLSASSNFTKYSGNDFNLVHHELLAHTARQLATRNIPVLLSNHDTELTRELYQGAEMIYFPVRRFISQAANKRIEVSEVLALFD